MSFFKSLTKIVAGLFGIDTGQEDLAKQQEEQIRRQQEAAKLSAANENNQVTQYDETPTDTFTESDMRTKKRSAGAYAGANALGLQIK